MNSNELAAEMRRLMAEGLSYKEAAARVVSENAELSKRHQVSSANPVLTNTDHGRYLPPVVVPFTRPTPVSRPVGRVFPKPTTREEGLRILPLIKARIAEIRPAVEAWENLPGYLKDRSRRPQPPSMFWVEECRKWVSVPLTPSETAIIRAGQFPPEEMSLAEVQRRHAADKRTRQERFADQDRIREAWHARHPCDPAMVRCLTCESINGGPNAAA